MLTAPVVRSSRRQTIKAGKSVSFTYAASQDLAALFEDFRLMCNDAIRIALEGKPRSRFDLVERAYPRLKEYGLHTHYILSACEVAYSVCRNRNRNKKSVPYIRRVFIKLDSQSYLLNHLLLRMPTTPRHFIYLTLQGSEYHLSFIDDLKRGSVTITNRTVSIAFSKEIGVFEPSGYVGVDINERNANVSATDGHSHRFDELGEVAEIKQRYREIRAKIERITRGDNRVGRRLLAKYGERERNRTIQRIHKITRRVVDYTSEHRLGIKMEKPTGIRRLYRKGNGRGRSYRGRMNTWVFGETQRQIGYKAAWLRVSVCYVDPRGTS